MVGMFSCWHQMLAASNDFFSCRLPDYDRFILRRSSYLRGMMVASAAQMLRWFGVHPVTLWRLIYELEPSGAFSLCRCWFNNSVAKFDLVVIRETFDFA